MAVRQIFLSKEVECPSCKSKSNMSYPNPRLYVAASRESDMHVVLYRWAEGAETNALPHYYAVWQCPACMYADFVEVIDNPAGASRTDATVNAFKNIGMDQKLVLASLRKMVPREGDQTFEGALALHLAALFAAYLPEGEDRNHNKIGRLALRIAWLFREQTGGGQEVVSDSVHLENLKDRSSRLERHLLTARELLGEIKNFATARGAELGFSREEGDDENSNPYFPVISSIADKLEEQQTLVAMIERLLISDAQGSISPATPNASADLSTLSHSLLNIKPKWPALPINEEQALRIAIKAFDFSYNHENYYQSIEQSMSVVSLIVDLFSRIGEHKEALHYVAEIYKSGMNNKQDLQRRIEAGRRNKTISPHDERNISRKIGNINIAIRQAGDTRRRLLEMMLNKDQKTIDKVLAENPEASGAEQTQALEAAGIPEEVIRELRNRGLIKEDKKKGIFGMGR